MNLATLRTRTEQVLGLVGAIDAPDVDEQLNLVWQYEIPSRIGGAASDGYVDFVTTNTVGDYDIHILNGLGAGPKILKGFYEPVIDLDIDRKLRYTDQPKIFWNWFDVSSITGRRPDSALLLGDTLTLRPIPDSNYNLRFYASKYRDALSINGILDTQESMLVVAGAARNLAVLLGRDSGLARAVGIWETYYALVYAKYRSRSSSGMTHAQTESEPAGGGF